MCIPASTYHGTCEVRGQLSGVNSILLCGCEDPTQAARALHDPAMGFEGGQWVQFLKPT